MKTRYINTIAALERPIKMVDVFERISQAPGRIRSETVWITFHTSSDSSASAILFQEIIVFTEAHISAGKNVMIRSLQVESVKILEISVPKY